MYSWWDGKTWSTPTDLFFTSSQGRLIFLMLLWIPGNILHLAWQGYEGIYYSSVPVQDAWNVKAWEKAQLIAKYRGSGPFIYSDSTGILHLIFSAWR